jgi:PAS domain S-box-containing protein
VYSPFLAVPILFSPSLTSAAAKSGPSDDLLDMPFEDLLRVEIRSAGKREEQIRYAILDDAEGRPFAQYRRDADQSPRDPVNKGEGVLVDSPLFGLGTVEVVRKLTIDGRSVGRIFIHARMDRLSAQLRRYAGMVGPLFLATLTVSLLLAVRLHRRVSDPILLLAAKTREISEGGTYAPRVCPPSSDDEIEDLYHGFNAMLEQIERREGEVTHIRELLAQLADERTQALDSVVRERRLILEAMSLGVLHLVGRHVTQVNPRAAELFVWSEEEMLGLSTENFYPDREAFNEVGRVAYAQMSEGGVYRDDRILRRKDGSRFWGRLVGQYIDPSDVDLGSIWILDDIGRDKALEERLRQAREAAEAANCAKDTFMANMSHDLRPPPTRSWASPRFWKATHGSWRISAGK